jgi:hypothetical protein
MKYKLQTVQKSCDSLVSVEETTDDTTSTEDSFPRDNFFPNISSLYIDDMDDTANANATAQDAPYVIFSSPFSDLARVPDSSY